MGIINIKDIEGSIVKGVKYDCLALEMNRDGVVGIGYSKKDKVVGVAFDIRGISWNEALIDVRRYMDWSNVTWIFIERQYRDIVEKYLGIGRALLEYPNIMLVSTEEHPQYAWVIKKVGGIQPRFEVAGPYNNHDGNGEYDIPYNPEVCVHGKVRIVPDIIMSEKEWRRWFVDTGQYGSVFIESKIPTGLWKQYCVESFVNSASKKEVFIAEDKALIESMLRIDFVFPKNSFDEYFYTAMIVWYYHRYEKKEVRMVL